MHRLTYSRACPRYSDFLDRGQLLTQYLLNQRYVALRLKSLLQKFYGRHHNLVDRYEISIFSNDNGSQGNHRHGSVMYLSSGLSMFFLGCSFYN